MAARLIDEREETEDKLAEGEEVQSLEEQENLPTQEEAQPEEEDVDGCAEAEAPAIPPPRTFFIPGTTVDVVEIIP